MLLVISVSSSITKINNRYAVLGLLIGIVALAACTGGQRSAEFNAELNTPFQLKIGQSAQLESEGLTIDFLEVTEDSRCPEDVQCVEAGQVSTLVSISKNGTVEGDYNLTIGFREEDAVAIIPSGLAIQLKAVDPYPNTTQPIEPADYIATFFVSGG